MAAGKQGGTRGKEARRQGGKGKPGKHQAPCNATRHACASSERVRSNFKIRNFCVNLSLGLARARSVCRGVALSPRARALGVSRCRSISTRCHSQPQPQPGTASQPSIQPATQPAKHRQPHSQQQPQPQPSSQSQPESPRASHTATHSHSHSQATRASQPASLAQPDRTKPSQTQPNPTPDHARPSHSQASARCRHFGREVHDLVVLAAKCTILHFDTLRRRLVLERENNRQRNNGSKEAKGQEEQRGKEARKQPLQGK